LGEGILFRVEAIVHSTLDATRRAWSRIAIVMVCVLASVWGSAVRAQGVAGVVSGVVVDSSGAPVLGAQVVYGQGAAFTETDERGLFRFPGLPVGAGVISVKRLGFRPQTVDVQLERGVAKQLTVKLSRLAQTMTAVVVRGQHSTTKFTGRIAEFYERLEQKNGGVFITRQDIDKANPRFLTDMMRTVPGLQVRSRASQNSVRMRQRSCAPLVWLDGIAMPAGEVDLDTFAPTSIEGVEMYLGATTVPAKYTWLRGKSNCGTILLWSRTKETYAATSAEGGSGGRADLEAMVASLTVYTADQVDSPSHADTGGIQVAYPPTLYASKVEGAVVAEFVVDTAGRVEPETFGVVSSTHSLFTEAVATAVAHARFVPATLQGRLVRQVVQQPFSFVLPGGKGKN
jgi:TonB family protein